MKAVTVDQFRDFFTPLLAQGPVHAIIVGDMELEAAVEAMRRTVASLPQRPAPVVAPERRRAAAARARPAAPHLHPPGRPQPGLCADRLVDAGRTRPISAIGARWRWPPTCSRRGCSTGCARRRAPPIRPSASHLSLRRLPDLGHVLRRRRDPARRAPTPSSAIAREIVADLAAHPALADEFARAQNPVVSGIERRLATNAYWIDALEDWIEHPE